MYEKYLRNFRIKLKKIKIMCEEAMNNRPKLSLMIDICNVIEEQE